MYVVPTIVATMLTPMAVDMRQVLVAHMPVLSAEIAITTPAHLHYHNQPTDNQQEVNKHVLKHE